MRWLVSLLASGAFTFTVAQTVYVPVQPARPLPYAPLEHPYAPNFDYLDTVSRLAAIRLQEQQAAALAAQTTALQQQASTPQNPAQQSRLFEAPNPDHSGRKLLNSCRSAVAYYDRQSTDAAAGLFCVGYLDAFRVFSGDNRWNACLPANTTVDALTHVYVKWMENNPKALDDDMAMGALVSVATTYMCQTTSTTGVAAPAKN